jgi:GT2 family glycosyltransferase
VSKIFYIQTYDRKANIGRAYNEHIACLPDDCWVVISDHDSNFLIPDFGSQLYDIIEKRGEDFMLFGAVTNRLRGLHQLHDNKFSNEFDMQKHFDIACERFKTKYAEVVEITGVAGVMMMFKKATWAAVGGFRENDIACDTAFNAAIKKKGGKIGLMTGVYIYHNYRIWQKDHMAAANDVRHLLK